jgi:hypothetical protein
MRQYPKWTFLFSRNEFPRFWDIQQNNFGPKPVNLYATVPKMDILVFRKKVFPFLGHPTKCGLVLFFKLACMGSDVIAKINMKNKKLKAFERCFNLFQRFYNGHIIPRIQRYRRQRQFSE